MKNKETIRSIFLFLIITLFVLLFTLPRIIRLANDFDFDAAAAYIWQAACLLAIGILITKKLSMAYKAYGLVILVISNAIYCVILGIPSLRYTQTIYFSSFRLNERELLEAFQESYWLFLLMNASLIIFYAWLRKNVEGQTEKPQET